MTIRRSRAQKVTAAKRKFQEKAYGPSDSVVQWRKDVVLQMLRDVGEPMTRAEVYEALDLHPKYTAAEDPLRLLELEGLVGKERNPRFVMGAGRHAMWMYYADPDISDSLTGGRH